jgi:hypothetical protein
MSTWNSWIVEWWQVTLGSFSDANKITRRHLFQRKICLLPDMSVWVLTNSRYPRRMTIIKQLAYRCTRCNIWLTPVRNACLSTFKINSKLLLLILTWKKSKSSSKKFIKPMKSFMRKKSHLISNPLKIQVSSRGKLENLKITLYWRTLNQSPQTIPL